MEGQFPDTRFDLVTGFIQLTPDVIIVSDELNHCLRFLDRKTYSTHTFAGTCQKAGWRNGALLKALFFRPTSLITYHQFLYAIEYGNEAIRKIDHQNDIVSRILSFEHGTLPHSLIILRDSAFVTTTTKGVLEIIRLSGGGSPAVRTFSAETNEDPHE